MGYLLLELVWSVTKVSPYMLAKQLAQVADLVCVILISCRLLILYHKPLQNKSAYKVIGDSIELKLEMWNNMKA